MLRWELERSGKEWDEKAAVSRALAADFSTKVIRSEGNFPGKSEGQGNAACLQRLHALTFFDLFYGRSGTS